MDPKILSAAKERAEGLFDKGRFREALDTYERVKSFAEKDPRIYLRMGDIARRLDDKTAAVQYYKSAVKYFVKTGFIIKAIAVCKMIISIDPSEQEIQAKLAELASGASGASGGSVSTAAPPKPAKPAEAPAEPQPAEPEPPAPEEIREIEPEMKLPKVPLFSDFNEEEFLAIVKKVRAVHLDAGEFLFHEGDGGDSIFFISEGVVEVTGRAKDGADVSLAKLKEGDVFGEFGFFSNAKRRTGVKAATATTILELTKADLEDIISKHKRVGDVLFNFYKERVVDRLMALSIVFQPLSAVDRKDILKRLALAGFAKDSLITREGEPGDTMYLIKEGRVSVWVKDDSGAAKTLTELEEGDFFGEIALATNKPRVASVTALTDVKLVEFSRAIIKDMITKCPSIKSILERVIKERVSGLVSAREHRGALI